jgi:hypothetical protein
LCLDFTTRTIFKGKRLEKRFSEFVAIFHGQRLLERAMPAGYVALIEAFRLGVPLPRAMSATGPRHKQAG